MLLSEAYRSAAARQTLGVFGLKIGHAVLSFLVSVVLARLLAPEGYGMYAAIIAYTGILLIPSRFGLPALIVRETSNATSTGMWTKVKGLWIWSVGFTAVAAFVSALLVLLVLPRLPTATSIASEAAAAGAFLVPLLALISLQVSAMHGLGRVVLGTASESVLLYAVFLAILLIAPPLLGVGVTTTTALGFHAAAAGAALAGGAFLLWRATPNAVAAAAPRFEARAWMTSALPLAVTNGMHFVNANADLVVLSILASSADVGAYRVAMQISQIAYFGLNAVNSVVAPRFARLAHGDHTVRLRRLVTVGSRSVFLMSFAVLIFMAVLGPRFLRSTFGEEFLPAYTPLMILLAGQLANAYFGSVGVLLNMTGHERANARIVTIAAAVNVCLNIGLIPIFGMVGAAVATALTSLVWNIALWRVAKTRLSIDTRAFWWARGSG